MNRQKIWYVYQLTGKSQDDFKGYCVKATEAEALEYAEKTLGIPKEQIRVQDTGATKPKCCPRR